jgi:hypothetical protein
MYAKYWGGSYISAASFKALIFSIDAHLRKMCSISGVICMQKIKQVGGTHAGFEVLIAVPMKLWPRRQNSSRWMQRGINNLLSFRSDSYRGRKNIGSRDSISISTSTACNLCLCYASCCVYRFGGFYTVTQHVESVIYNTRLKYVGQTDRWAELEIRPTYIKNPTYIQHYRPNNLNTPYSKERSLTEHITTFPYL